MAATSKIVIKAINKPGKENAEVLSEWFCEVFDLANNPEAVEPQLFQEIAESNINGEGITSKELNEKLEMPRSTVIYHLNRFIYSGLVIRRGRKYYLRSEDMESTIEDLQSEMVREFDRMLSFAQKMDEILEGNTDARRKERK